jgi:hypothetical protein
MTLRRRVLFCAVALAPAAAEGAEMRIERRFTKAGQSPYQGIEFRPTTSEIRNPDGSVVFRADDVPHTQIVSIWTRHQQYGG